MRSKIWNVAAQAVEQRLAGDKVWRPVGGRQTFDLLERGMCAKFVRQCVETAYELRPFEWEYARATAREDERALRAAGLRVDKPQPGDIVCLNNQSYKAGHIAIFAGPVRIDGHLILPDPDGTVSIFENTSSGTRGKPRPAGTKVTPLSVVVSKLSGYYRAMK